MATTFARLVFPSSTGASITSTTSPLSSCLTASLSAAASFESLVSVTTFMTEIMIIPKRPLERKPSSSSSRPLNTLDRLSAAGAGSSSSSPPPPASASPSFFSALAFGGRLQFSKNLTNSASQTLPSLSASKSSNSCSLLSFSSRWWNLMMARARPSTTASSASSFLLAMSRILAAVAVTLLTLASQVFIFASSTRSSPVAHALMSSSMPSARLFMAPLVFSTSSFASATSLSKSSASPAMPEASVFEALPNAAAAAESAFLTSSSEARIASSALAICSLASFFIPSSTASFSSRSFLRSSSFSFSRAQPIITLSLWKSSFFTPFSAPRRANICLRAASLSVNLKVVLA
mmetsp:Transcript_64981/g.175601  ORF Transcript_64981/g.175601 Transcript_64981/m.175601 type:complete len:349 (-) Transcript_64981:878-1924(-)